MNASEHQPNTPAPSSRSDFEFIMDRMRQRDELRESGAYFSHDDLRRLVIVVAQLCNDGRLTIVPWLTSEDTATGYELWDDMAKDIPVHPLTRFGHKFIPAEEMDPDDTDGEPVWDPLGFVVGLATHPDDASAFPTATGQPVTRSHLCARITQDAEEDDNWVDVDVLPDSVLLCPGCIDGWLMRKARGEISLEQELALRRFASLHGVINFLLVPCRLFLSAPLDEAIDFERTDVTEHNDL
jgi:hypothetical protein